MNILEHDSEGKYYHEYISRGSRSNQVDAIIISDRSSTSNSSNSSFLSSSGTSDRADGLCETFDENSFDKDKAGLTDFKEERGNNRMERGDFHDDLIGSIKHEQNSSVLFTCENCSETGYKGGDFETIKLGDIFTHITQFPSSEGTREGPRLCAQCLSTGHPTVDHTAHDNNIRHNYSIVDINNLRNNYHSSINYNNNTVATSGASGLSLVKPGKGSADSQSDNDENNGERSAQLLQGVPTIIMQNSNLSQHHQLGQFQHHSDSPQHNIHSQQPHSLQSPPPPHEMHHDHQQHFYQQGGQIMQQVKLETDLITQQPHGQHLDNFMLIHDTPMFPDNNDSLQHQQQHMHQSMVSFHHQQPDEHLLQNQQQCQQVICDNQSQEQAPHHQSAIQHITVVTPGSDIKYTIPTSAIQMQVKEEVLDQAQGQPQQHLIQFSGQNHVISLPQHQINGIAGGTSTTGVESVSPNFQFAGMTSIDRNSPISAVTTMVASSVVTHTASTSSIMSPTPPPSAETPSTETKSPGNKSKTKSPKSGPGANSTKTSTAQQGENPKIPCDLCKKKFKNPKMVMNHYKRVHQKEARFVCEICGAVFSYR